MKFVVLALCVCAAVAAPQRQSWQNQYQPYNQNQVFAQAVVQPVQPVVKSVYQPGQVVKSFASVQTPGVVPVQPFVKSVSVVPETVVQPVVTVTKPVVKAVAQTQVPVVKTVGQVPVVPVVTPVVGYQSVKSDVGVQSVAVSRAQVGVRSGVNINENQAAILRYDADSSPEGNFHYAYNTDNGIAVESNGFLKKVEDSDVVAVQGYYEYPAPDGTIVRVDYVADENGFQPRGDLLPVAPPVPEAIARSLQYIASVRSHQGEEYNKKF